MNSLIKSDKRIDACKINSNNVTVTSNLAISNIFNEYFSSVASNLASNIPNIPVNPIDYVDRTLNSFVNFLCDTDEISRVTRSFKSKGSHFDFIPSSIYKHLNDIIAPILSDLINSSIREGVFPNPLKLARVLPIHRAESKQDVKSFRPISTLPFVSNTNESFIHGF